MWLRGFDGYSFPADCGFSCPACWSQTETSLCSCGAHIGESWEQIVLSIEDTSIEARDGIDEVIKKEWFSVSIWDKYFSNIKVKTEKGCARIYFTLNGIRRSVLINPNLQKKIISKTGGFVPRDIFMSMVSFVNHLCKEKEKYELTKYKAFQ